MRLRPATTSAEDVQFLHQMLYEAATWRATDVRPVQMVLADPTVLLYVRGWGRPGDVGFVAEDEDERAIGAAWYRSFRADEHGFGFVAASVPEVSIAVRPEFRRRGVGSALLEALVDRARVDGVPALSLSVEEDNPAVRLYERAGFVRLVAAEGSWTMQLELG